MYDLMYDRFHVKSKKAFKIMVGAEGFELSTSSSQSCVHRFVFNDLDVRPRLKLTCGVKRLGLGGTTYRLALRFAASSISAMRAISGPVASGNRS